jgi:preprotein translocase subunit SecA
VLLVTRSQPVCNFWSETLTKAGMEHQYLKGAQDEKEAAAFADAAAPGRITVAPHFVARCCSIVRVADTEKLGGLRVIFLQLSATDRHSHGLLGRSLPAGVPGSVQRMLSLDDELIENYAPAWWRRRGFALMRGAMLRYCQWRFSSDIALARSELLRVEDYLVDLLAFTGSGE